MKEKLFIIGATTLPITFMIVNTYVIYILPIQRHNEIMKRFEILERKIK